MILFKDRKEAGEILAQKISLLDFSRDSKLSKLDFSLCSKLSKLDFSRDSKLSKLDFSLCSKLSKLDFSRGSKLKKKYQQEQQEEDVVVLAIPRGGVPIGFQIAKTLNGKFDLIIPRKIPIPWNKEAGFGAVICNEFGSYEIVLNKPLVKQLGLSRGVIQKLAEEVFEEVKRRNKEYRGLKSFPKLKDKIVILVDDGLATGITMLAAIKAVRKRNPKKIIVASPVTPQSTFNLIKKQVDEIVVLFVQPSDEFAVASFYEDFSDLSDEQVRAFFKA